MPAITEIARAKVNLTLKVRGRRPDGYHEIESLVVFAANLGDIVRLVPGEDTGLSVRGPFAAAIEGDNLIDKALLRVAELAPSLKLGEVTLEKTLPVAAGIGGGSADAAALLRALRFANGSQSTDVDWAGIAASLGADVPVCFMNRAAFVTGTGEMLAAIPDLPRLNAVLVNPLTPVPLGKTRRVFAALGAHAVSTPAAQAAATPGPFPNGPALVAYMAAEGNDLMPAAIEIEPAIAEVRAALAAVPTCKFVGLSGAGPTCYGIFATAESAAAARETLRAANPRWWVAATTLGG
jgi:4-diphosphocytidyl-2-C-methyl-D-erythritol kinase